MKILLCLLLFFICFSSKAQNAFSVSGTVTNKKGETIPGATVFITNTRHITSTNNDGKFTFIISRREVTR